MCMVLLWGIIKVVLVHKTVGFFSLAGVRDAMIIVSNYYYYYYLILFFFFLECVSTCAGEMAPTYLTPLMTNYNRYNGVVFHLHW